MTDLLSRPTDKRAGEEPDAVPVPRPLAVGAVVAGVVSSVGTLFAAMTVCIVGWFLAEAGAHGQTTGALRVGADIWLVGHGSGLVVAGTPFHVVPLALTGLFALAAWRAGRWAARTSGEPEDDRALLLAGVVFSGVYVVVAVLTCILAADGSATPQLGRAIAGSLLVSLVGAFGIASGAGRLGVLAARLPAWARTVVRGATTGFLALVAASLLLVLVRVALGLGDAATMMSALHLEADDAVMYVLATLTVLPNAAMLGGAYLLGPGFAVGTGTLVSPGAVTVGALPAFPLFAALPSTGPTPGWAMALLAVPVLAGAFGAMRAQRACDVAAYDAAALHGFGGGLGAAVLTTAAIAVSGGAVGTGRMADIGAPVTAVFVAAAIAMSLGGLVAGVATAFWQRRHGVPAEAAQSPESPEDTEKITVHVPVQRAQSPSEVDAEPEDAEPEDAEPEDAEPEDAHDDWEDTVEVPLLQTPKA